MPAIAIAAFANDLIPPSTNSVLVGKVVPLDQVVEALVGQRLRIPRTGVFASQPPPRATTPHVAVKSYFAPHAWAS